MEIEKDSSPDNFLDLITQSKRGKFKIYIGMCAGVGKTYRMLQEAHSLKNNHIDVQIGYIETHGRTETAALLEGLPVIPRRTLFYKGKELEEMDVNGIIQARPDVVIVDELAHTNIEGSIHEKRWQDVVEILNQGINVISAVNIQHIEGMGPDVEKITGAPMRERVPDKVLDMADEVVNIDLTANELLDRLKEGKIYKPERVGTALQNFFQYDRILQLRELALKEVTHQVERKIDVEIPKTNKLRVEHFLACISTNQDSAKIIIRKTARLASYYHSKWFILYVQTPREKGDSINLASQRHLINNFKLGIEMGAEIIKVKHENIAEAIMETTLKNNITTICMGKPRFHFLHGLFKTGVFTRLLGKLNNSDIDLVILS